jgi:hypothetical protein
MYSFAARRLKTRKDFVVLVEIEIGDASGVAEALLSEQPFAPTHSSGHRARTRKSIGE